MHNWKITGRTVLILLLKIFIFFLLLLELELSLKFRYYIGIAPSIILLDTIN